MFLKATVRHPQPGARFTRLLCGHHSPCKWDGLGGTAARNAAGRKLSLAPPCCAGKQRHALPCEPPISAEDAAEAEQVSPKQRQLSKHPLRQQRRSRLMPGKLAAQAGTPAPRTGGEEGSASAFSLRPPELAEPRQQAARHLTLPAEQPGLHGAQFNQAERAPRRDRERSSSSRSRPEDSRVSLTCRTPPTPRRAADEAG